MSKKREQRMLSALVSKAACEVRDVSAMLAALGISVGDAEAAVDIVKLFELIMSNGYVSEDGNLFGDWRAVATAVHGREWRVHFVYGGPPSVSVLAQPEYRLLADRHGRFMELREVWAERESEGSRR